MTAVNPLKSDIQVESLKSGAAASEASQQKMAQNIQFWNIFGEAPRSWTLNGGYWRVPGAQSGVDGGRPCFMDMEIYGIFVYNLVSSGAGSIEFDIIRHAAGGGSASIFTQKPSIPVSAGNNAWLAYRFSDSTTLFASLGVVLPTLLSTQLTAGDMLTCNVTQKQSFGEDAGIVLAVRPRNP